MTKLMFTLITLTYFDETNLNVLNIEGKYALEVIELGQRMLHIWTFSLSISGGDLKLDKFSWTMKYYYWNEGQCILNYHTPYQLNVKLNGITR